MLYKINAIGLAHTAGVGIVWSAGRNRQHAGAGGGDLVLGVLGAGGGGLSGGNCTGEDEDDDEGADDGFHRIGPLDLLK